MKKFIIFLVFCVVLVATGCTDFGTETQLTLPAAPAIEISNIVAESDTTISFSVSPTGTAGFYSWMVEESDKIDSTLQAIRILDLKAGGLANGIANYTITSDTIVKVKGLTPFTMYQIYAVASSVDGVVGVIKNASVRTLDDGNNPSPQKVVIEDSTVTLAFSEPLQRGTGKVYVSYFAKNTLSGDKPLIIEDGYESFNPQDMEVPGERISVSGSTLTIMLPSPPAGVYASITYDKGAVLDLDGNAAEAYTSKPDTLNKGVPTGGITVGVANKPWDLHSEFEDVDPDTLVAFSDWNSLLIYALPDENTNVKKKIATNSPTVTYKEKGKVTNIDVTAWGLKQGIPVVMLPEEPAFGAVIDISIPEGAFEDVYGNVNNALDIEDNYLYSYGYTDDDIVGTYDLTLQSYWGETVSENGITIEKDADSPSFLVKNLFESGTTIEAIFDPDIGTLTFDDGQLLVKGFQMRTGPDDIYFVNGSSDGLPVVFKMPATGNITSDENYIWGYYALKNKGWIDVFISSVWTRR